MNRLTKIIKGKCGHDQIYYTPKYGNPITPIDMTDWGYNTLANHLYDILNRLKRYEDTGLEPEEIKYLKAELDLIREFNALQLTEIRRYKDLEEQGLLIKLPCKLGTKLFIIQTELWADGKSTRREKRIIESEFTDWNILHIVDNWGKTVFLTREEAEKALEAKHE